MSSHTFTLPDNQVSAFHLVEFPGKVLNQDKAMECLGGSEHLSECLSANSPINLSFRPSCPYTIPITSKVNTNTSLLVEIDTDDATITDISCIGHVLSTHTFPTISDYQVLPPPFPLESLVQDASLTHELDPTEVFFAVSKFSSSRHRDVYKPMWSTLLKSSSEHLFSSNFDSSSTAPAASDSLSSALPVSTVSVSFDDLLSDKIPRFTEPSERLFKFSGFKVILELVEESPVWLRYDLLNRAGMQSSHQIRQMIADRFYSIKNGPWRRLLCLKGLNLVNSPENRKYQIIDCRHSFTISRDKLAGISTIELPSTSNVLICLNSLNHPSIRSLIDEPPAKREVYVKIKPTIKSLIAADDSLIESDPMSRLVSSVFRTARGLKVLKSNEGLEDDDEEEEMEELNLDN
ncbi:hypothetical protein GEMRC1_004467 [Eukaryota sp. GEM-RC1]